MHRYRHIGKFNAYVILDCTSLRDKLLVSAHNFGGTTPRAARCRINIPTLQSYRLWSLFSIHHNRNKGTIRNKLDFVL